MTSGTKHSQVKAYNEVISLLRKQGCIHILLRLDNNTSENLKDFLDEKNITLDIVPPHFHQCNATKQAIRMFKDHCIASLCGTEPDFPINL